MSKFIFEPDKGIKKGTYALILSLDKAIQIEIGKLGSYKFKTGFYVYVGSAFGNGGLQSRLTYHLNISKNPHWHIDYFRKYSKIKRIWFSQKDARMEHEWANIFLIMSDKNIKINKFGSSDCLCDSHFFYFNKISSLKKFQSLAPKQKQYNIYEINFHLIPKNPF